MGYDENGEVKSIADEKLTISAKGAEVLGFGSGEKRTEESFVSGSCTTHYGRVPAAVRVTKAGQAKVTVKGTCGAGDYTVR